MGYLSQKKNKVRLNVFFAGISLVSVFLVMLLLINPEFGFWGLNLFHFYCISILLFLIALFMQKWLPVAILGISALIIYVLIAMSGNLFFSDRLNGSYRITAEFNKFGISNDAITKGNLVADEKSFASYAVVNEDAPIMLIKVDFRNIDAKKYSVLLKSLHKFIIKQDIEVVLFGDFAMPSWSKVFRKFTEYSGMTVKNRFIFDSIGAVPSFYVLGYNNIGISDIEVQANEGKVVLDYNIL